MTNNESGLNRLANYLGLSNPKQAFLLPVIFLAGGGVLAYFLPSLDRHVRGGAPVTQFFLELVWFALMVWGVLGHRKSYREKYGERAYRKIAEHYFLFAGILMFTGILRPIWVEGHLLDWFPAWFRGAAGFYFLTVGILLEIKGVKALGIDRVVFVYTVFPERGTHVQSALYQFLRHPLYSAMSHMVLGIAFFAGTGEGIWCAALFILKLFFWSKIEEKELIGRLGESYAKYMKEVPAFFPKIGRIRGFLNTLFSVLFLVLFAQHAFAADLSQIIEERSTHLEKIYQNLHQHPELSKQEKETSAKLAAELKAIGFEVTQNVGGYGVVAYLKNGEGPVGLIRTDMDALPVQEATGLSHQSQTANVMHACGHDVHMSVFLGTAYALAKLKDQWKGTLIMIAQPAEEIGAGAARMIQDGLFEKFPKPDYALALHVMDYFEAGLVGYTSGYSLANVDSVDMTVFGKGGHGAKPNTAIDPIVLSSQIILGLQTLVSREKDPIQSAVVTVGSIHGGTKHNIIPDQVHLQLTVRSYEEEVRRDLKEGIQRIAHNLAAAARAPKPKIVFSQGTPSLYNDPKLVGEVVQVFEKAFGKEKVKELPKAMWGEDFSQYGRQGHIPIFMFGLGAQPKSKSRWGALHSPNFSPDFQPTLKTGIEAMARSFIKLQSRSHPL